MAKPTEGIRPLKGKAGKWLSEYMTTARVDHDRQREIERRDKDAAAKITPRRRPV